METFILPWNHTLYLNGLSHQSIKVFSLLVCNFLVCIHSVNLREKSGNTPSFIFVWTFRFFILELCNEKHANRFLSGKCGGVLKTRFTLFSVPRKSFLYADFSCGFHIYVNMTKLRVILETKKFRYKQRFVGLWNETKNFISVDLKWNFNKNSREFHVISCIFQQKM